MVSALDVMTPSEHKARRLSILTMQMNIQQAQAKAAADQQAQQRQRQLQQFFQQYGPGIASGNPEAINALAGIDPEKAIKVEGSRQANLSAAETTRKSQFERVKAQTDYVIRALTTVKNVPPELRGITYKQQLAAYRKQFPDTDFAGIPEDYNEQMVDGMLTRVMSVSEQLAAQQADPENIRRADEAREGTTAEAAERAGAIETAQQRARARFPTPAASDNALVNVRRRDGTLQTFRRRDPALDAALREGAVEVSTAASDYGGEAEPISPGVTGPGETPEDPRLATSWYGGAVAPPINAIKDFLGLEPFDPAAQRAAQQVRQLNIETRTALAQDVRGNPSNYLLRELDSIVASSGGGRGPQGMMNMFVGTQNFIKRQIAQAQSYRPQTKVQADNRQRHILRLQGLEREYTKFIEAAGGAPGAAQADTSEEDALMSKWGK
jgi:hypothetical protein